MTNWVLFRELENLRMRINEAFSGIGFGNPFGSTTSLRRKSRLPVKIQVDKQHA